MKTKNVKVRERDIRAGRIIYRSHPVYGIERLEVASCPYRLKAGIFFDVKTKYGVDYRSIVDAGIAPGNSYNYRRTFFKRKHAEDWAKKMATDPGFHASHARHLESCEAFDDSYFYDYSE